MKYAELVCHTNFSFLKGASHPEELVQRAAEYGYSAIAITDECSVAGIVRAYAHIKKFNLSIKLIIGSHFIYDGDVELVVICTNRQAYAELCRVITNSRKYCEKGKYKLTRWDLASIKHCLVIWLPTENEYTNESQIDFLIQLYKKRLYIGISRLLKSGEYQKLHSSRELSEKYQIPCVAIGSVLLHDKSRLPLQHTLTAIKHNCSVDQLGALAISNSEATIRPVTTLKKLFKKEELLLTNEIADKCTFELSELKYEYPSELIPKNFTPIKYLRDLVNKGIKKQFAQGISKEHQSIIEKELDLIEEMGYEHFFITIYDIIQYAQKKEILYQGRGSAANSIVCYCLEITAVHPDKIQVLFERFISKERKEPPDIDVDFEHQRREEIFQYIYNKYGHSHTAITATVVTYRLKSAIREVGKALRMNPTQLDFFIKNINRRDTKTNWAEQIHQLGLSKKSHKAKQFISLVNQIRGFPRHLSQHVGGFVISSGPLYELVPTENAAMENRTVIQWDKDDLETLELLKVDILALGMLTAIKKSFDQIKLHYELDCTISQISNWGDDRQVYQLIQNADTVGIFQIESRAQMSMLPRLKPKTYYDLVIQIAIVRPGPIQGNMVHPFLKRRDGLEKVSYPSKDVASVLSRTMGVPIFQEQVIKIAMVAANFSGGEADQLRRSMGRWKYNGEMEKFRTKLINGMLDNGYQLEFAERIFEQILGFGDYGFPESHSASFAILAFVSSWLKHYFPEVFYCALLNSYPMGFYSPSQIVQDAKRHKINVLPPCINNSDWEHTLEKTNNGQSLSLRLGLKLIKGLKQKASEIIINDRKNMKFESVQQLKSLGVSNTELQALASGNALNAISKNRYASRWELSNTHTELELFKTLSSKEKYSIKPTNFDNLIEDYSSLGLSLDHHPITLLRQAKLLNSHVPSKDLKLRPHKSVVTVVGLVIGRQSPGSASGVTFMTLEDDYGSINVVVWMATARAQKQAFLSSKIVEVRGIMEKEKDVIHVIAGKITDLTEKIENLKMQSRDFH